MLRKDDSNGKNPIWISNVVIIICSCFTFGIFAPLEIFFANSTKIWFDIYDLLFPTVVYFVGILVAFIALLFFLYLIDKPKLANIYSFLFASVVLVLYVIGNFVPVHISMVDGGESVNWIDMKYDLIHIFIILFFSVVLILLYRSDNYLTITVWISMGVFMVQLITLVFISFINPGDGWRHRDEMILSEKNFHTYSRDLNMEILVLDEFDARVMTEIIKDNGEYASVFDGFTYYPDTTSMYNFSDCSVAQMITGTPFIHQSEFSEYLNQGYASSYLINRLKGDYILNIYDDIALLPSNMKEEPLLDNYIRVNVEVSSKRTLMKYMYRLVGCKYLPFYFRKYCWFATDELEDLKTVEGVDGYTYYEKMDFTASPCNPANTTFYRSIDNIKLIDKKMFHWHHLRGIHAPRTHDANMLDSDDPGVTGCARGLIFMLKKWIKTLKDNNVYDNHVIIILADHGTKLNSDERFRSVNSLFMVKGYNEHHELLISDKRVSYSELDNIYENLLNGKNGDESVEELDANSIRYFYRGVDGYYADGDLIEYIVPGKASDIGDIHETGVVYR